MPETRIRAGAMLGIMHAAGNFLEVRFRTPANDVYCIEVPEGILGGLTVALLSAAAKIQGTGPTQPMTLNSAQAFTYPDGRIGLELKLENAIRLPVLFPPEAISSLRDAAKTLDHLSKQIPGTSGPRRQ